MKRFFLAFAAMLMAFSVSAAELNIYASGLKAGEVKDGKVEISYLLNAPATSLELQLIGADNAVVKTIPITDAALLAKGAHTAVVDLDLLNGPYGTFTWALKAAGEERTELSADLLADDTNYDFYQPRGVAADINPESPFFGQIYMGSSKSGVPGADGADGAATPTGVAIFDATFAQQGSIYDGGITWEADGWGPGRVKVGEDGMVYINDHAKTTAGVFKMDPANPTANFTPVLDTAQRGVTFALPVAMEIIGSGAERTLYTWNYIGVGDGQILKYAIGENDNYALAPDTFAVVKFTGNQYAEIAADGRGGWWLSQNRGQIDAYHALAHMTSEGVIDYHSGEHTDIFTSTSGKYSTRGIVALNKEKTLLAMAWDKTAVVFSIAYDETTGAPTLTKVYATNVIGTNVDGICFDYAGNLIVGSASSERLHVYATPSANVQVTPAPKANALTLVDPRPAGEQLNVYAYGLSATYADGNLTVNYSLNAFANEVSLLLFDGEGKEVVAHSLGYKQAGAHEATIDLDVYKELVDGKYTWAIKAQGDARTKISGELLKMKNGTYWQPRDIAINQNPESSFFGQMYMSNSSAGGTVEGGYIGIENAIYVFNPLMEAQGTYKGGIAWENDRGPYRLYIDEDDKIFISHRSTTAGGIYIMDPANPTADFKPFFADGKALEITGFDFAGEGAERELMIADGVGYSAGSLGRILKYTVGETKENFAGAADTVGTATALNLGNQHIQIAHDGRGGWFICQSRAAEGSLQCLTHINAEGVQDYRSNNDGLGISSSPAGALAISKDYKLLAMAADQGIAVFELSWAEDGKPVLTLQSKVAIANNMNGVEFDYAGNIWTGSSQRERLYAYALPTENVTTTPAAAKYAIDYVGPGLSGKYIVGGEGADFASLAEAFTAANAKPLEGDVMFAIAADLTEPVNVGIQNPSAYNVTVAPAAADSVKITFTQATDNAGPSGNICIGCDMTLTHACASVLTQNVVIDGQFEGDEQRWLTIEASAAVHKGNGPILFYGNVKDCAIRNTNIYVLNNNGASSNYGVILRAQNKTAFAPVNVVVENNYIENTSGKVGQAIDVRLGSGTVSPKATQILNNEIVAATRGVFLEGTDSITIVKGNTIRIRQTQPGYASYGIWGYNNIKGILYVQENKIVELTTAAATATTGVVGIQTENGSASWVIENNYVTGFNPIAETIEGGIMLQGIATAAYSGGNIVMRHNTVLINDLPATVPGTTELGKIIAIKTAKATAVENNLIVSHEQEAPHSLISAADANVCKNNVYYAYLEANASLAQDTKSWEAYQLIETTAKFAEVHFTDAAKGDLSLAAESNGDVALKVPAIAEVTTDITGATRHAEYVYAGAWEGGEFKDDPTAIENTEVENSNVRKVFENGNVYIIRDGVKYNLMGTVVE